MKVVITGASGFVGRYVLKEFLKRDVEILAIVRNSNKLKSLNDSIQVVEMDIYKSQDDIFEQLGRPDALVHLAWGGLPNYNSYHHFESELPNQYQFLKNMITGGLPLLFVSGTCLEYGMQSGMLNEKVVTVPSNSYALAKDTLRKKLELLKKEYDFNFIWARLFYMYGDGQAKTSIFQSLKNSIAQGYSEFNMSPGKQIRDFMFVETVAKYICSLVLRGNDVGVVNICSGQPISVEGLVNGWIRENNWDIKLNLGYYPYPDYEPMSFWGDCSLLHKIFNEESSSKFKEIEK